MKFLNDFKNVFAIVGVVSIIFWTCASESTSTNVNPPQLIGGNYQMEFTSSNLTMHVLNTETGVYKRFSYYDGLWNELIDYTTTFTH